MAMATVQSATGAGTGITAKSMVAGTIWQQLGEAPGAGAGQDFPQQSRLTEAAPAPTFAVTIMKANVPVRSRRKNLFITLLWR